jgi:hypothetical protein
VKNIKQSIVDEIKVALTDRGFAGSPENIQKLLKEFMQLVPETLQSAIDNIADELDLQ